MNMFEDFIDELKEENLLEATVIETGKANGKPVIRSETGTVENLKTPLPAAEPETATPLEAVTVEESFETLVEKDLEFYRKRAMDEVTFLQIVEHVFAGVEREQLKIIPKPHNDLEVKKVLHSFVQMTHSPQSAEHAQAQFQLMQETESWHSSLTLRDERLTTADLRRFFETSRPPLSAPALVALARFYRNSPYSEPVRNKFDLVLTRLFSKESGDSCRETIFTRDELAKHLTELYAEWSSVPMYSTEIDDAEILEIVGKFESFISEADAAILFDDLIENDFYTRLHSFKRSTNENFYSPLVTAVGIESNIRIGNRYVELLEVEKSKGSVAGIEDRYGFAHDNIVSEATGKTFSLIELLKQRKPAAPVEEKPAAVSESAPVVKTAKNTKIVEAKQAKKKQVAEIETGGDLTKWIIVAATIAAFALVIYLIANATSP